MKRLILSCLLALMIMLVAIPVSAQVEQINEPKVVGLGLALFQYATPQVQGFGFFALPIRNRVFSYTDYDVAALPGDKIPGQIFTFPKLQYAMRTGFAIRTYNISKGITLYGLGDAGIATDGGYVVGSFSGGGFVDFAIGKGWGAICFLQVDRNAKTGTQFIPRLAVRKSFK